MNIVILESARDDLAAGVAFYETQEEGLGEYFRESLISDVDSLETYAGIHEKRIRISPFAIQAISIRNLLLNG